MLSERVKRIMSLLDAVRWILLSTAIQIVLYVYILPRLFQPPDD